MGKIVSKIEYKFIYKGKHDAKINFKLKLKNKSIIDVIAYDEVADKLYQTIYESKVISILGKLNSKMQLEIIRNNTIIIR